LPGGAWHDRCTYQVQTFYWGFKMGQQVGRGRGVFKRWRGVKSEIPVPELELDRRTAPDARMNLVLRFATESGPRTIIASGVALSIAADIAREMEKAGHFAQFIDQLPLVPMAERIKRPKAEKQAVTKRKTPALSIVRERAASAALAADETRDSEEGRDVRAGA